MTPTNTSRRRAVQALAALSLPAAPFAARGKDKVVKFILPKATGSGVDAITRTMRPAFARAIGADVIFENQPPPAASSGCSSSAAPHPTARRCRWSRTTS